MEVSTVKTKNVSILTLAILGTLCGPSLTWAASIRDTADNMAVLAGMPLTSTGASIVTGGLGVNLGTSVPGFASGAVIKGMTGSRLTVSLINDGPAGEMFWRIGSSTALDSHPALQGNVLAQTSIHLNPLTSIGCDQAWAQTGAVALADTNSVYAIDGDGCGNGLNGDALLTAIPLPAALPLLGIGLAGLMGMGLRQRKPG